MGGHKQRICSLGDLDIDQSKGFRLDDPDGSEIFIVRTKDEVVAYRNQCPHTGGPLDWMPDQFLSLDKNTIQCATHDARFLIDSGLCVSGPCVGQSLQPLEVVVDECDEVFVLIK